MSFLTDTLSKQAGFVNVVAESHNVNRVKLWYNWIYCFVRYGATPSDWYCNEMWRHNHSHLKEIITCRKNIELDKIFNPREYKDEFDIKSRFNSVYSSFVKRQWLHYPTVDFETISKAPWKDEIVIKPLNLSSGRGIFTFNPCTESWDELEGKIKGHEYLFEERVRLHPDLEKLNPPSCQTIRFYTIVDASGNVHIPFAVLRVGGGNTIMDNFHAKGVTYPVDMASGRVTGCGKDLDNNEYLVHPSSGIFMPGFQIPNWEKAKDFVRRAAMVNTSARFIGWDVAIMPDGCEMIEGNYFVYCGFIQIFDKVGKYSLIKSYK